MQRGELLVASLISVLNETLFEWNYYCFVVSKLRIIFVTVMNFKTDLPQIMALRQQVEAKVEHPMKTHGDFLRLVKTIENELKEHISESTLERVWGYSTRGYDTISLHTLSLLARFIGDTGFQSFCERLKDEAQVESEMFLAEAIITKDLEVGDRLQLGWQPNRLILVRYLGEHRFVVEETENSSIQPGDKFSCLQIQKGREMYMDLFQRASEVGQPNPNARYVVGQQHGLTTLKIIEG